MPPREKAYQASLASALQTGHAVLARGASALDAVEAAVRALEDDPLFNAGRGAVFTHEGTCEMDASIMDGQTRAAGAVAGVSIVKNPVTLARKVMEASPFVLLSGAGAHAFAIEQGVQTVPPAYFHTDERWAQRQTLLAREAATGAPTVSLSENKFGTVGAVAVDHAGNLAAATSTGGMTGKRYGRIGDSPLVGAGVWADNATCAVSSTGHGEFFVRFVVAHDIAARMAYKGLSVAEAAHEVIHGDLVRAGGAGGVIALDAHGNFALPFNTPGMYRGWVGESGEPHVFIFA